MNTAEPPIVTVTDPEVIKAMDELRHIMFIPGNMIEGLGIEMQHDTLVGQDVAHWELPCTLAVAMLLGQRGFNSKTARYDRYNNAFQELISLFYGIIETKLRFAGLSANEMSVEYKKNTDTVYDIAGVIARTPGMLEVLKPIIDRLKLEER